MEKTLDMRFVSHVVLGAPVLLTHHGLLQVCKNFPSLPNTSRRKCTVEDARKHDACMLLPHDAEFFSIVVDKVGGVYVQPQGSDDRIYCLQPQFASLSRLIPADSACRAIVYFYVTTGAHPSGSSADSASAASTPILGVYDMTRLEGNDLQHMTILQRHELLHNTVTLNFKQFEEHMSRASATAPGTGEWNNNVRVHWVGWQEACVKVLETCRDIPFKTSHICRLDENEYVKMLTPVTTRW